MFLSHELTESYGKVALVYQFVYHRMGIKSLFSLAHSVKLRVKRRKARLLIIILLGESELGPHPEFLRSKPFEDEVVRESES